MTLSLISLTIGYELDNIKKYYCLIKWFLALFALNFRIL